MDELELIIDFHKDALRQGPGSRETTEKAFKLTQLSKSANLTIADIGCGTGGQTLVLAEMTESGITAVDLFPEFIDRLKAINHPQITPLLGSMDALSFKTDSLDLIWSEGAVYIMGFKEGTQYWRQFLKDGGILAVSELTWLTDERPDELEQYWTGEYPQIATISEKIRQLEDGGYELITHFTIPESDWIEHYYAPMEQRADEFLKRHNNSPEAQNFIHNEMKEIGFYKKFKHYFGYVFYIARKV